MTSADRAPAPARPLRWPWLAAAALLVVAAACTAWSTDLHWLPCRGQMLSGTVFRDSSSIGYSDACLHRMDTSNPFPYPPEPAEQAPWASQLGAAAMALSGAAWLVLVLGMRLSGWSRVVAVLPTAISLVTAMASVAAAADRGRDPDAYISLWFLAAAEIATVAALVVIRRRQPEVPGRLFGRLVVVAWGTTAFGLIHQVFDYALMTLVNSANWDNPPGTGYGTALVLLIAAVVAAAGLPRLSRPRPGSAGQPARPRQTAAGPPAGSPRAS